MSKKKNLVLIFNSIHLLKFIEIIYFKLVDFILEKKFNKSTIVIARNDKQNKYINYEINISGIKCGKTSEELNVLSFKFYKFLRQYGCQSRILFGNVPLYNLYTRQIKLKLYDVIEAALQLHEWSMTKKNKEYRIISDAQTIDIIFKAFNFLELNNKKIIWDKKLTLTFLIKLNSVIMRLAAIIKIFLSKSSLPKKYYRKKINEKFPSILITLPSKNPKVFLNSYVKKIKNLNIILYSLADLQEKPDSYEVFNCEHKKKSFNGLFSFFGFNDVESYIVDTMLIYSEHVDLYICTNVVEYILNNEKIDILLNRQQVHVVNNHFVNEAKKLNVSIISDVFEEIYLCDAAILSCRANLTKLTKFVLGSSPYVIRGVNEFVRYRLFELNTIKKNYIKNLLGIEEKKKVIFYASDPLKQERQRYDAELFLINKISSHKNYYLVVKIHPQDSGEISSLAFNQSNKPKNVKLIKDKVQKHQVKINNFYTFDSFDFNAALASSDGFITSHSSSVLQALSLNIKIGILDMVRHNNFRPMIDYGGAVLIKDSNSLKYFLDQDKIFIPSDLLKFYGLDTEKSHDFNLTKNILKLSALRRNIK